MESPNEFTGSLKQQCLDESGLYEWIRKNFTLKIEEGSLEIYPNVHDREPQSSISLTAARHAKEWSISSAIAGYGFDIVWASGKMWSFLADNEGACQSWYETYLFHAIMLNYCLTILAEKKYYIHSCLAESVMFLRYNTLILKFHRFKA